MSQVKRASLHCRATLRLQGGPDSITRVSALELGKYGCRERGQSHRGHDANVGVVLGRDDIGGPFLEQMPLGRWATEAEIAAPIVFLLSDAASMITGVSLPIDGGYTSR